MESSPVRNADDVARGSPTSARRCARAAGYWKLDQDNERLVQLGFVPGVGLDPEVGRQFAAATAMVPLSQTSLGIVAAGSRGNRPSRVWTSCPPIPAPATGFAPSAPADQ